MSLRIREKLQGKTCDADEYVREMTALTGEYIDQFTTVDLRPYTDKILSRVPKCCVGHKYIPPKPLKLKPATERDTSRDKQRHRE